MVTEAGTIEETLVLVGHRISAPIRVRLVVLDAEEDLDGGPDVLDELGCGHLVELRPFLHKLLVGQFGNLSR